MFKSQALGLIIGGLAFGACPMAAQANDVYFIGMGPMGIFGIVLNLTISQPFPALLARL